jgi:hypothetical protein
MPLNKRTLKAIAVGHLDRVLPASEHDLRWGRGKAQRVTIKGLRLYARKGGPIHAQVFVGRKWVSMITIPWLIDPSGFNSSVTARCMKSYVKGEGIRLSK